MHTIHIISRDKYNNPSHYRQVEDGIHQVLVDGLNGGESEAGDYVIALSFTLENEEERNQRSYLLEDILDAHSAFLSESITDADDAPVLDVELSTRHYVRKAGAAAAGIPDLSLQNIQNLKGLVGKRVCHREVEIDGTRRIQLVIEQDASEPRP